MTTVLRYTPLYEAHVRLGGRMVPFGGWEMPVQYKGILAEVRAVRTDSGIFDVSHMGRIVVDGPDAQALLDWVHTADIGPQMAVGRARYGLLCNEQGGIIDDGIVYRLGPARFLLVANAANTPQVLAWLLRWQEERFPNVAIEDTTDRTAMIALQGPEAIEIAAGLVEGFDPAELKPFRCIEATIQGRSLIIARTGYTGEDGVEVMPAAEDAPWLWDLLIQRGTTPCGLGARDILRLEAGLLLHGSDMDASVDPIEAGLDRFVASKGDFSGAAAIQRVRANGPKRQLVAFRTTAKGALPRAHSPLLVGDESAGEVTSGGYSPTLDSNIGLGYVPVRFASPGARLKVDVRGNLVDALVVSRPFYSRPR